MDGKDTLKIPYNELELVFSLYLLGLPWDLSQFLKRIHYVGPIDGVLPSGSEVWITGFDHQAWLDMASYYITAYKTGSFPTLSIDKIYFWYRTHSKSTQILGSVPMPQNADWAEDIIVVHALLTSDAQITVANGGNSQIFQATQGTNTFQVNFQEGNVVCS